MREKIIKRFAAGTIGVCFAYALIRQPFAVMNDPKELISSDWSTAAQSAVQPTNTVTTIPSTSAAEQLTETPTEIAETIPPAQTETEAPETETVTNPVQEEIVEDKNTSQNSSGEEIQPEQNGSGGDVPTLSQFLSTLICGGCRRNCSLISPRCMKGRAKAESATVEYYETYGA